MVCNMVLKIKRTIMTGLNATPILTLAMLMASFKSPSLMNLVNMLERMSSLSIVLIWLLHFGIGIVTLYFFLYDPNVQFENSLLKGVVFGLVAFVSAPVMMVLMPMVLGQIPKLFGPGLYFTWVSFWATSSLE